MIRGAADVPGFWLTLTYEDVAGKGWITKARYIATDRHYTDVTVNTQEEGPYGLRRDRALLKPSELRGQSGSGRALSPCSRISIR